jgi:F0F1-type ATP synthase membrane subunit b/b'
MIDDAGDEAGASSADGSSKIESAKETAQDVAGKAQEMAGPAKEKAGAVADQAKAHAQAAAEEAKSRAAAQVDERSTQVGQQIGQQAQAIDGVAEELRRQGKDGPAKLAEQASERVKGVASHLEQTDGESLVAAASDFARENPAVAAAAGAAAGFVAGRVIKASTGDDPAVDEAPGAGGG